MDSKDLTSFYQLVLASLDGTISEADHRMLLRRIQEDPEARASYVEFLAIYTNLAYSSPMPVHLKLPEEYFEADEELKNFDSAAWKALLETERTAPSVVVEKPVEKPPMQPVQYPLTPRKINRLSLYTAILTSAALLAILVFFHFSPVPAAQEVATVTGLVNVEWGDTPYSMAKGSRLRTNSGPIQVNRGVVGLSYDSGVEVTIEGPAVFRIVTPSEIQLEYGRLYSEVSSVGLGFTVQTFNTRIIDLGTEFGVQAFAGGATELHVYKGKTALVAGVAADKKQAVDVSAGQARSVCADGSQVNSVFLRKGYFAEKIAAGGNAVWRGQNLSLASLVAGGDGFSEGNIRSGVDPASGEIHAGGLQADNRVGNQGYHAVAAYAGIDGVFIPNGQTGANRVSSGGHAFTFPATNGHYWSDITAYPYAVDLNTSEFSYVEVGNPGAAAMSNAGLIFLHANAGITFDLRELRRRWPGLDITEFRALCGVGKARQGKQDSEFWVLLDGERVFYAQSNAQSNDACGIEIAITPDRQFLTLAVTDGGDGNSYDWCAFADPELLLKKQ